jgi:two-component system, sensor histidine kinase and response regulator
LARVATHLQICRQKNELKNSTQQKTSFFSIIAHDLRGPIGNMLSISELMTERGQYDEDTLYSFLEMQKELSKDTVQLLENLLIWARSNTNRIDFEPLLLDFNDIVKECNEVVNVQAMGKNISVINTTTPGCRFVADENMIRLIVRNLLSNAIKFTPKGGRVEVSSLFLPDQSWEISIRDTGIGIPEEMIKTLFRIDVSNKRYGTEGETSNGLGLLLCKEFVEKHGGNIWVESEEGKGTVFYFTVPTRLAEID